jgi:hypothetical protein
MGKATLAFQLLLSSADHGGGQLLLDLPLAALIQQGLVGVGTYAALLVSADRPRGGCCVPNSVHVRDSAVAGRGLFATEHMAVGTILGRYPGVCTELMPHLQKLQSHPHCEVYIWRFSDGRFVIDPTNQRGHLDERTYGGNFRTAWVFETVSAWSKNVWTKDTMLCRINEPPLGSTTNVCMAEHLPDHTVTLSLLRNVYAGEELFADYGPSYDRSGYGKTVK